MPEQARIRKLILSPVNILKISVIRDNSAAIPAILGRADTASATITRKEGRPTFAR